MAIFYSPVTQQHQTVRLHGYADHRKSLKGVGMTLQLKILAVVARAYLRREHTSNVLRNCFMNTSADKI